MIVWRPSKKPLKQIVTMLLKLLRNRCNYPAAGRLFKIHLKQSTQQKSGNKHKEQIQIFNLSCCGCKNPLNVQVGNPLHHTAQSRKCIGLNGRACEFRTASCIVYGSPLQRTTVFDNWYYPRGSRKKSSSSCITCPPLDILESTRQ